MDGVRVEGLDLAMAKTFVKYLKQTGIELSEYSMDSFNPMEGDPILERREWSADEWHAFLKDSWEHKFEILKEAGLNDFNFRGLPIVKLKDLTVEWLGQLIELEECNIASIAPNRPIQITRSFKCHGCKNIFHWENGIPKKFKCCSDMELIEFLEPKDMIDAQWIRVKEINKDSNNTKIPMAIPVLMKGKDMIWKIGFNERVKLRGLLRFRQVKTKMNDVELHPWFEVFGYEKTSGMDEEITLSEVDRKRIRAEMDKPGYWNKVVKSFCPWIYGQEVMKEVVLLGIGSMKTEMPLRILIIGDPSTAKSDVLKAGNMLPAQKHYTVMKNNRGTGLTVTSVKDPDTDQWTVEGGEFSRANKWCLIIDEFQAGREEDIDGLNSVIWDHKIPYSLAGGVHGEFEASCVLIFACNPQGGIMAKEQNIHELLKFVGGKTLPAFITRMTFILYLEENEDKEFQKQVAGHIYDNLTDEIKKQKFWEDWYEDVTEPTAFKGLTLTYKEERFGIKTLQKIVKYVTEEVILDEMPSQLKDYFVKYYVDKRMNTSDRVNKIISPRYMVHCLGIAQNKGRWHGRTQPNEDDMKYAFELMLHHMTLVATDPVTGEMDVGMVNGNIPERQMKDIELEQLSEQGRDAQWEWACHKAMALHKDEYFDREELVEFLKMIPRTGWQYKGQEINKRINHYIGTGALKTNDGERYKWKPLEGRL